ncbi:MAG: anthranilate synthase component I [Zetaproteobacteria bacterium CG1_02_49_23]|nr:MAG: anthranilate synthase component I [Zetaproteobacteria bacterium CG1_02_49_23]
MKLFRLTLSADCSTPVAVFASLRDAHECFLLESAEGGEHWGRYSMIGVAPSAIAVEKQHQLHIRYRQGEAEIQDCSIQQWIRQQVIETDKVEGGDDLPFTGGAVGYFAYDIVHQFEPGVAEVDVATPLAACMIIDRFVIMDSLRGVMHVCVLDNDAETAQVLLNTLAERITQAKPPAPMRFDIDTSKLSQPHAHMSAEDYQAMVVRAKEYILAGDVFQVVLSQRFSSPLRGDPLAIYRAVRHINPSPYLFYLHLDDTILIGSSPEILVKKEGSRAIVRPIAGTRPRGQTTQQDVALEKELLADEKELAEHVMLVDLGRNDLGRVCEFGSVEVSESMCIERYSHVMHIVSQVEGTLREDVDALDLLAATFPAGTLSGAPKVRAMQIIQEQESEARGPYGGCIGYISFGGVDMDTAIIIRTAVIRDDTIFVQAGAGIVADSDPAKEHQECVNKASAMFRSVAMADALNQALNQAQTKSEQETTS